MLLKKLMDKPILAIGIIMFTLFVFNKQTKVWWDIYSSRFRPNTCNVIKDRLKEKMDADFECQESHTLLIHKDFSSSLLGRKRQLAIYRTLANDLVSMAKISNEENLPHLPRVSFKLKDTDRTIHAVTSGEHLVKFKTLQTKKGITDHLKETVKVKEIIE